MGTCIVYNVQVSILISTAVYGLFLPDQMHILKVRIKGLVSCPVSGLTQNSTMIELRHEKKIVFGDEV